MLQSCAGNGVNALVDEFVLIHDRHP